MLINWKGKPLTDLWINIPTSKMSKKEKQGYPTQKSLVLLERLIENATNPGDLILNPFYGCATTCVTAEKLDRKWVGIDISHLAYRLVEEFLVKEVQGYSQETKQPDMFGSQKKLHFKTEPPIRSKDEVKLSKWGYVISNSKHPNEYKVGITSNYKKRLRGYQTLDPSRAYRLETTRSS